MYLKLARSLLYKNGNIMDSYHEEDIFNEFMDDGSEIDMIELKTLEGAEMAKQRLIQEVQTSELKNLYGEQRSELKRTLLEQKLLLEKYNTEETLELEESDWMYKVQKLDQLITFCKKRICYVQDKISEMDGRIADLEEREIMHLEQSLELERLHEKELNDLHIRRWMEEQSYELNRMHEREMCSMHERKWTRHQHAYESHY